MLLRFLVYCCRGGGGGGGAGGGVCSLFYYAVLSVPSRLAIILIGELRAGCFYLNVFLINS